jgi:hypothetical protein
MIRDAMTLRRGDRVRIETIIGTFADGRIAGFARRRGRRIVYVQVTDELIVERLPEQLERLPR